MKSSSVLMITCFSGMLYGLCWNGNGQHPISTVKDGDGNIYKCRVMDDRRLWMIENLNTNLAGSDCYDGKASNCVQYGRLYTWTMAAEGCKKLGTGWRLPSNKEWEEMAGHYGGVYDVSPDSGALAFTRLTQGGNSSFNPSLGGGRDPVGSYARAGAHGFYWTATESTTTLAWMYNFGNNSGRLYRHPDIEKLRKVSVRCLKD